MTVSRNSNKIKCIASFNEALTRRPTALAKNQKIL